MDGAQARLMRAGGSERTAAGGGYAALALATWPRPKSTMASVLALRPREAVILAFGMIAMLFIFLARIPAAQRIALPEGMAREALIAAQFVTLVLFAPLFLYGFAALLRLVFRLADGKGDWYGTRLAMFWALMVTAPVHGLALVASHPVPGLIAAAAGGWVLSGCLAAAEGVRHWHALLVAVGLAVALLGLGWLLAGQS